MTTTGLGSVAPGEELHAWDSACTADRHGTASALRRQGCTCPAARRDKKRYSIEYRLGRPRTVDATGTRRRIHALMAIGWTGRQIMAELGWAGASLGAQLYQADRVYRSTAARVADLYERLSMTPGPSSVTRRRAARAGWLPPLAWDDDTIDDPAYQPGQVHALTADIDPVAVERAVDLTQPLPPLNPAEKRAVFALLLERNGIAAAAQRLRLSGTKAREWAASITDEHQEATG